MNTPQTRQELLVLKKKKKSITKSKNLLEDKKNSLIKKFMSLINDAIEARSEFEKIYIKAYRLMQASRDLSSKEYYSLMPKFNKNKVKVYGQKEKLLGVDLMKLELSEKNFKIKYSRIATNQLLDESIEAIKKSLPSLIRLVEKEYAVRSLSREIIKVRRRVNALEHIIIPGMAEGISKIEFKLEELAQSMTVMLMKVKEKTIN